MSGPSSVPPSGAAPGVPTVTMPVGPGYAPVADGQFFWNVTNDQGINDLVAVTNMFLVQSGQTLAAVRASMPAGVDPNMAFIQQAMAPMGPVINGVNDTRQHIAPHAQPADSGPSVTDMAYYTGTGMALGAAAGFAIGGPPLALIGGAIGAAAGFICSLF